MRSSLLLAAVPLAAALPHGQPAAGVFDKLKRLVSTNPRPLKVYSHDIPSEYYELANKWYDQPAEAFGGAVNDLGEGDTVITTTVIEYPPEARPTPATEPTVVNEPEPVRVVAPKTTAVQTPEPQGPKGSKADNKSDAAKNSTLSSYQAETLKLHNEARQKAQGDPRAPAMSTAYSVVELSWSAELEDISRAWAEKCEYRHSGSAPTAPGIVAENIAAQPTQMAADKMAAMKHSWESWYTEELPAFDFNFGGTVLATGHVRNILNPAFNKVGQASHLCPQLRMTDADGTVKVMENWHFTVSSFSGPPT